MYLQWADINPILDVFNDLIQFGLSFKWNINRTERIISLNVLASNLNKKLRGSFFLVFLFNLFGSLLKNARLVAYL